MQKSKALFLTTTLCAITTLGLVQKAGANLITNGDFETTTAGGGQLGFNTVATGWASAAPNGSFNFLFTPGTADHQGVLSQNGPLSLWGPQNGSANGLGVSPTGGNFVAMNGVFNAGPLTQTINGLTAGSTYTLSFYWAAAQQFSFDGPTVSSITASLGGQSQTTTPFDNADKGFSGWMLQTDTFTATGAQEVLSFLANGSPAQGAPPFALLDGVDLELTTAPDTASTLALLGMTTLALGIAVRCRRQPQQ